jgi:hypothetical protein
MNPDFADDDTPSTAPAATDASVDEDAKPPLRAYIPGILVLVVGFGFIAFVIVTFYMRSMETKSHFEDFWEQRDAAVERFEQDYGVSIDDPGSYSTEASEWVIDGKARVCAVSDDTLPAAADVELLCFNAPMVELERS